MKSKKLPCPQCGEPIPSIDLTENPAFPFCSNRCKMVDLGRWFAEDYKISRPADRRDEDVGES